MALLNGHEFEASTTDITADTDLHTADAFGIDKQDQAPVQLAIDALPIELFVGNDREYDVGVLDVEIDLLDAIGGLTLFTVFEPGVVDLETEVTISTVDIYLDAVADVSNDIIIEIESLQTELLLPVPFSFTVESFIDLRFENLSTDIKYSINHIYDVGVLDLELCADTVNFDLIDRTAAREIVGDDGSLNSKINVSVGG